MTPGDSSGSERALVLAPFGRDAAVASTILREAEVEACICPDVPSLCEAFDEGAGLALIVEEVLQEGDYGPLARCIERQAPWSDFPVIILAKRGGGIERNPAALRYVQALGNVTFLERPFHPTTLVSVVQAAIRGRRRQYEARDRLEALRAAVARQQRDQDHLRLMVNELNHRVKNTLATVQSIVSQTLRGRDTSAVTRDTLAGRIVALSKAHDVLTNEQWAGASLIEIANQAAQPFLTGPSDRRICLSGPDVRLPPKTAIAIALALHELATNAVKYGALSVPEGRVDFSWTLADRRGLQELHATWREMDGPSVAPPTRAGFGTRLIQRGLAADLNGEVKMTYPADGVVCMIRALIDPDATVELLVAPPRATPRQEATAETANPPVPTA